MSFCTLEHAPLCRNRKELLSVNSFGLFHLFTRLRLVLLVTGYQKAKLSSQQILIQSLCVIHHLFAVGCYFVCSSVSFHLKFFFAFVDDTSPAPMSKRPMRQPLYSSLAMTDITHHITPQVPGADPRNGVSSTQRLNNVAVCCHVSVSIPLIVVGFFILVYAVLGRIAVESPEGSLYFIGPILVLAGIVFCCRVSMLRKRVLQPIEQRQTEASSNLQDELTPQMIAAMTAPPPAYDEVVASNNTVVVADTHQTDIEVGSHVDQPPDLLTIHTPVTSHVSTPVLSSGDRTRGVSPESGLEMVFGATGRDMSIGSGSISCSSSTGDPEPLPPSYSDILTFSQQNLQTETSQRPLPPSYTSLQLADGTWTEQPLRPTSSTSRHSRRQASAERSDESLTSRYEESPQNHVSLEISCEQYQKEQVIDTINNLPSVHF